MVVERQQQMLQQLERQLPRLPIFPLSRVSLFPGAMLPLYVFEPRYREMTAHCLLRGGAMAVATLLPGHEADYEGRPPVRPIAGAGLVVAHRANPDGTYNILLQGLSRVVFEEELPAEHLYREVRARLLPDLPQPGYDMAAAGVALLALTRRLAAQLPQGGEALLALCEDNPAPVVLCDLLAAALVTAPTLRLSLLESADAAFRMEQVSTEVARLLQGREPPPSSGTRN